MISYLIDITFFWTICLLFYLLFLRKSTHLQWSRFYLLFVMIIGPFFPIINAQIFHYINYESSQAEIFSSVVNQVVELKTSSINGIERATNTKTNLWLLFYGLGIFLGLSKLLTGIGRINSIRKKGKIHYKNGMYYCYTKDLLSPFSFLNTIYLSDDKIPENHPVLLHEKTHIKEAHTIDILICKILSIILWCIIPVHFFSFFLAEVHEYIADRKVLSKHQYKNYINELINHILPVKTIGLAHSVFSGNLSKRLIMMKKKKTSKWYKLSYLAAIPLIFMIMTATGFSNLNSMTSISSNSKIEETALKDFKADTIPAQSGIFKVVEEMPRFPGCEHLEMDLKEREQCAQKKMLTFLFENLKYPAEARKNGTQGMVVIGFIVDHTGRIKDVRIARDLEDGCGEEALRVVRLMTNMSEAWIPGKQKGKAVSVEYNLPIKFKLDGKSKKEAPAPPKPPVPGEKIQVPPPPAPPPPPPPPPSSKED